MFRILLLCLIVATSLAAQAKPVDLGVAYPGTTLVYGVANAAPQEGAEDWQKMLRSFMGNRELPDFSSMIAERLELKLTQEELEALATGTTRISGAILDITISGPKLQLVLEHRDLAPMDRALAEAARNDATIISASEAYEGTTIYNLEVKLGGDTEGVLNEIAPIGRALSEFAISAAVLDNKFLVLAPSASAAKDAIDGLQFPDDPTDTLAGNRRFLEALKDFEKPDAQFFVNMQTLINTTERLSGDRGSSPIFDQLASSLLRELGLVGLDAPFIAGLTQYEQLKSFAAASWNADDSGRARFEARLSFHNTPGWLEALKVPPRPLPLLHMLPQDTIAASTSCIDDFDKLYNQCREFLFSRAREAGKLDQIQQWPMFDAKVEAEMRELWGHLGTGQVSAAFPTTDDKTVDYYSRLGWAFLFGVKDLEKARLALFERGFQLKLLSPMRDVEGDLSPVEIVDGVEIHSNTAGTVAFAFFPDADKKGVLAIGSRASLRRMLQMRRESRTLDLYPPFRGAVAGMWPEQNLGWYANVGAVMELMGGAYTMAISYASDDSQTDRDDAEIDSSPMPRLSEFLAETVALGGSRSGQAVIEVRLVLAGVPGADATRSLVGHFNEVADNFEVRDDLLRVREGALNHLVLTGEAAASVDALLENGRLKDPEHARDPFGGEEERTYLLAVVPASVDIRQAVLLAYQAKPGLRDKHLAVLWNGHVVAITPAQLASAIERAARGERLDESMYEQPLLPLHERPLPTPDFVMFEETPAKAEVLVIDDDGDERIVQVGQERPAAETEKLLDEPQPAKAAGEGEKKEDAK